jgi:hypothetical protein
LNAKSNDENGRLIENKFAAADELRGSDRHCRPERDSNHRADAMVANRSEQAASKKEISQATPTQAKSGGKKWLDRNRRGAEQCCTHTLDRSLL